MLLRCIQGDFLFFIVQDLSFLGKLFSFHLETIELKALRFRETIKTVLCFYRCNFFYLFEKHPVKKFTSLPAVFFCVIKTIVKLG